MMGDTRKLCTVPMDLYDTGRCWFRHLKSAMCEWCEKFVVASAEWITQYVIRTQCPTSTSGLCFVDCTKPQLYHIACEGVNGQQLYGDLITYNKIEQQIVLSVWNSPLNRIGYTVLRSVQLIRLELDNLLDLEWFPEARGQRTLRELVLMNCPKVKKMPLEYLPESIQSVVLFQVGITEFTNDFEEVPQLPLLTFFAIHQSRIEYIEPNFFNVFPNLVELEIIGSTFGAKAFQNHMLHTIKPLKKLRITKNKHVEGRDTRVTTATMYGGRLLEDIVQNTAMEYNSELDLSDNAFPISQVATAHLENLRFVKKLYLQRSIFETFVLLSRRFQHFEWLQELDLSYTGLLASIGTFAGLKTLKTLKIAGNDFRDLTVISIFKDCEARNLQYLDLSDNYLNYLPIGMERIAKTIRTLNLCKNTLKMPEIFEGWNLQHITPFRLFANLDSLDLSYNSLETFNGIWLADVLTLVDLNLGCNSFTVITKEFFQHLPFFLETVNLTFCASQPAEAPLFQNDTFSTLPPIKVLILQHGFLKERFFNILKSISIDSLLELDLSSNSISRIPDELINKLPQSLSGLETLKLKANKLQSIGPKAFAFFNQLRLLDLSRNRIISVGSDDFVGLDNLQTLTIIGNAILEFQPKAFAPLVNLRRLYIGENNDTALTKMFPLHTNIGKNLIHLSVQHIPISCVPAELLQQLKRLKWLYLDDSRSINFQYKTFRGMAETFTVKYPFRLLAYRTPTLKDIGCETFEDWSTVYNRSAKFVVKDKNNLVQQHMTFSFPSCHVNRWRNLKDVIENLIC